MDVVVADVIRHIPRHLWPNDLHRSPPAPADRDTTVRQLRYLIVKNGRAYIARAVVLPRITIIDATNLEA